jgi:CoA:oxalate CoA-transferase
MAGVMGTTLDRQPVPPMPCFQAADYAPAGYAVAGLLGAIIARQRNGRGRHLDIAMFDSMFAWSNISLAGAMARHAGFEGRPELEAWGDNPRYDTYATADGKAVGVCLLETRTWQLFCDRIGRPDLYREDETHADRHTDHGHREGLYREAIAGLCASMERDTLTHEMMSAGIPVCPIYSPDEAVTSPYAEERGLLEIIDHPTEGSIPQPANPLSASGLANTKRRCAPALGADTEAVLAELGYAADARAELIHAIGAAPD